MVEQNFAREHQALYGFVLKAEIELVTLRVEASGLTKPPAAAVLPAGGALVPYDHVQVHFAAGPATVPVADRAKLGAGTEFSGPVILTQLDTTTLVAPGWNGAVQPSGAIRLTRARD